MNKSTYLLEEYVTLNPGDPIRLFPFGDLVKDGEARSITPEIARRFKLPHFKPPIKLGSHKDEAPAGAFITGLEVKEDGLWANIEVTEKGAKALAEGDYRYHSPEVIWEGFLEDPETGNHIEGPLILGDALLHTPHLGEAASLFTIKPIKEKQEMTIDTNVSVPRELYDRFVSFINRDPAPDPEPSTQSDEYVALAKERDDLKAKHEALQAENAQADSYAVIAKEFETKEYGMAFVELGQADEASEMLAGMTDDQRNWVLTNFKALSAQIDDSNFGKEKGENGEGVSDNPTEAFNAAIKAAQDEFSINYKDAFEKVSNDKPALAVAYANQHREAN